MKFLLLLSLLFSQMVAADTKLSLFGSVNFNNPEFDDLSGTTNVDEASGVGFGAGLRALMGINNQLHVRSGAGLVQKKAGIEYNVLGMKGETTYTYTYLSIPLALYWKASPQVGFFGGTAMNAKMADDCETSGAGTCESVGEKSLVFPAIIGFDFNFTDKFGMELSYEHGIMETAKDLRIHSAVASFLFHF
jgi:hypothetical protein